MENISANKKGFAFYNDTALFATISNTADDITYGTKIIADKIHLLRCLIEAKATGDPLIRDLRLGGIPAIGYTPKGDKNARVQRAAPFIECGLIYLSTEEKNPERLTPFAEEFLETVITFPNGESKDFVDSMTQAILYLRDFDALTHTSDVKEDDENRATFRKLY